jgi:hypothetical protein
LVDEENDRLLGVWNAGMRNAGRFRVRAELIALSMPLAFDVASMVKF